MKGHTICVEYYGGFNIIRDNGAGYRGRRINLSCGRRGMYKYAKKAGAKYIIKVKKK